MRKGELLLRFYTRQAADEQLILKQLIGLEEQGGFQRLQLLEQQDQAFELKNQLTEVREQQGQLRLEADQLRLEVSKSISQMRNRLVQAELQLQYQNVGAPTDGLVFDPKVRPDGVVAAGETLLKLVPQAGLFAEVFVPNKEIGFVKTGQQATVRVDAFPSPATAS